MRVVAVRRLWVMLLCPLGRLGVMVLFITRMRSWVELFEALGVAVGRRLGHGQQRESKDDKSSERELHVCSLNGRMCCLVVALVNNYLDRKSVV